MRGCKFSGFERGVGIGSKLGAFLCKRRLVLMLKLSCHGVRDCCGVLRTGKVSIGVKPKWD